MGFVNPTYDRFNPANDITLVAAKAVTGRRFISFTGTESRGLAQIKHAEPGGVAAGVAAYDAEVNNLVGLRRGNRVITVEAEGQLTVGAPVQVGDAGKAVAHTDGHIVGTVYAATKYDSIYYVAINL